MLPVEISFLSPIFLHIMHNVTPLIYNLEIERAIRRLDPFRPLYSADFASRVKSRLDPFTS